MLSDFPGIKQDVPSYDTPAVINNDDKSVAEKDIDGLKKTKVFTHWCGPHTSFWQHHYCLLRKAITCRLLRWGFTSIMHVFLSVPTVVRHYLLFLFLSVHKISPLDKYKNASSSNRLKKQMKILKIVLMWPKRI